MKPAIPFFLFAALLPFLVGCGGSSDTALPATVSITLLQPDGRLDTDSLITGLSLTNHEDGTSGAGLKRQRWDVPGLPSEQAKLEIIGDNPQDADLVGGHCQEFDQAGSTKWPWPESGTCWKLLRGLLANTVDQPDVLLKGLVQAATQNAPATAIHDFPVLGIELDADGFFFLRKPGRKT